ncbi:MAG: hypothetical protein H6813_02810 [Phycisphaeraceae bacterium]|nr:hypothetical protein [Phycisphaeraceae bacterium]MCB9848753.1 hypothetical protein [Phycisphaeraceae bacterium]
MPRIAFNRIGFPVLLFVALLAPTLGGCATRDHRVTTMPAPAPLTELGLDIDNPYGSVKVEVTGEVDHICMTETLLTPAFATDELRESLRKRLELSTQRVQSAPDRETLRVRVVALEPLKAEEGVNLTVRLPSCEGIRVRNTAGDALLIGVSGAIQVETIDGDIEVRCDEPVRSPVALIADSGNVYLQTPGGDEGRIELFSNSGDAVFTSTLEPLVGLRATRNQVLGVLNNGANPVTLRSDTGSVRMLVIENPMTLTRWKTGNRRIASPEKYGETDG